MRRFRGFELAVDCAAGHWNGKASEETFDLNPGQPSKPLPVTEITALDIPPQPAKKHGALLVAAVALLVAMAAAAGICWRITSSLRRNWRTRWQRLQRSRR